MTDFFVQLTDQYDSFRKEFDQLEKKDVQTKAQKLLDDMREAGKSIADPEQRIILSGLARGLGETIFDISRIYPSVHLDPPAEYEREPIPFIYGRPVQPGEFLNREAVLRTIFNRLRNGESTAIVGEPHIGKTSLLLRLADEATLWDYLGDDAQGLMFSLLNLHYISSDYSPATFWEKAFKPLYRLSGQDALIQRLEQIVQAGYPGDDLEELVGSLHRQGLQLVLLLDEFEQLVQHSNFQTFSFYATLRALTASPGFSIVTSSRLALSELEERVRKLPTSGGSPAFNLLIETRLLPFDAKVIKILLDWAGDAFSHRDRRFIRLVAGHHPYLVQAMAAALLETTGKNRHARASGQFYDRIRSHFDDLWRTLDNRTRTTVIVLGLVEMGNRAAGDDFNYSEIEHIDVMGSRLRDLDRLGLAEQVGADWPFDVHHPLVWRGERWTLRSQALAWWMRDVAIAKSHQVSAYDKWVKDNGYCSLLTQEQWDRLLDTVHNACGQKIDDISVLAGHIFQELEQGER